MKNLTLVLLSVFGLVFFNSCKDEVKEDPPSSINILNELKDYTGKPIEQVSIMMQSKGFTLSDYFEEEPYMNYIFINFDTSIVYEFFETQESKISMVWYETYNNNRNVLINTFEKNSQSSISFIGNTPIIEYEGGIAIEDYEDYEDRNAFLSAYNQSKDSLIYCFESWTTSNFDVGSSFTYENYDNEYDDKYCLIGYVDRNLEPQYTKSNIKSLFEKRYRKIKK